MMHALRFLMLGFLTLGCGAQSASENEGNGNGTDSNTHWLSRCQEDSDCEGGLSCLCGVCSETCSSDSACNAFSDDAVCSSVSCAESGDQAIALCTLACEESSDCPGDAECSTVCLGSDATESDVTESSSFDTGGSEVTETDPDTVVNACAAMDARSSGDDCVQLEGFAWNGGVCETVNCGCVGADCDDIYPDCIACYEARAECSNGAEIPAECVAATPEPDQCAPMDAQSNALNCLALTGFAWDGDSCEGLLCGCAGSDCGDIYIDCSTCYAAHAECLNGAEVPAECVPTPLPDECGFLTERAIESNCSETEAACAQAQSENQIRQFTFYLNESFEDQNGNNVAYSDAELEVRWTCMRNWLLNAGVEVKAEADGSSWIGVEASWEEVSELADSAALQYSVGCGDMLCDDCFELDETACSNDAFCQPEHGTRIDTDAGCNQPNVFAGCMPFDRACDDAGSDAVNEAGQCWFFPSMCYLPGFTYNFGIAGCPDDLPECTDLGPE